MMKRIAQFLTVISVIASLLLITGCENANNPVQGLDNYAPSLAASQVVIPAGVTLESATFNVYVFTPNDQLTTLHSITSVWDELTVTWNNFGGSYDPTVIGSFTAGAIGWYSVDVTSLVNAWIDGSVENFGILLDQDQTEFYIMAMNSRENGANHPYLEICYTSSAGTVCESSEAIADSYIWALESHANMNFGSDIKVLTGWMSGFEKQSLFLFDAPTQEPRLASIGDFVWNDLNMDGIQDRNEPGIEGIIVQLFACDGEMIAETITDATGYYIFSDLEAGEYMVRFILPDGYTFSPADQGMDDMIDSDADPMSGETICITLDAGESDLTVDAGMYMEDCSECLGGVIELTLRYLGQEPAYIEIFEGKGKPHHKDKYNKGKKGKKHNKDKKPGSDTPLFSGLVGPGETLNFVGLKPDGKMGAEIRILIDGEVNANIHTSCSKPIGPGMVNGDFEIVMAISKDGGLICETTYPESGLCDEGRPRVLTMLYTGQSCDFSNHSQSADKAICSGDPDGASLVNIVVSDKKNPDDPKAKTWFDGTVELGTTFDINAGNAGATKLGPNTCVLIYDLAGNLLQNLEFHSSCSQPLNVGDQFGSLILEDFMTE